MYVEGIEQVGSVRHVEMLFRTNLIAIVGGGSHPKYADNTGMYLLTDSCSNICFVTIIFYGLSAFNFYVLVLLGSKFQISYITCECLFVALEHFCC